MNAHLPETYVIAAQKVRRTMLIIIPKTWPEFYDERFSARADRAIELTARRFGSGSDPALVRAAVGQVMPELFAGYWRSLK